MNFFNKINNVPLFSDIILESIDVYNYKLVESNERYPEYKFVVPATEKTRKFVYTVNLDSGYRGNVNDYEVTFYFGKDDGDPELYSRTINQKKDNVGMGHLYSVLATLDAILLDAAEKFPVRDYIVSGEHTSKEVAYAAGEKQSNAEKNESTNVRTSLYLRYADRHYPKECISYEEETGIMRIHAYELPNSMYEKTMAADNETSGVILSEGAVRIPYNDYSDFRKIKLPGEDHYEFNVELKLNGEELDIHINPLPRDMSPFMDEHTISELFNQVSIIIGNMAVSLDGGANYPISLVRISSSAIPVDSVSVDASKALRLIGKMVDSVIFRTGVTFTQEYKNGSFLAKCDTTIANLN